MVEDAQCLNNRTMFGIVGLAFLALFAVAVPALLHPTSSLSESLLGMSRVRVEIFTATGSALVATNQYSAITGLEVSYSGVIYSMVVNPSCATEPHACALPEGMFFYLVSGSSAYRLIPSSEPLMFANGARVLVTGILVIPSSWNQGLLGGYTLAGDIYVQSIRAA